MTKLFRLFAACAVLAFSLPAAAAERVALVIGNGAYVNATELPNPANDAHAVAAALENIGFTVIKGVDLDHSGMERSLRDYVTAIRDAKVALFYYSGHGLQVNGKNYLVPVDASLVNETSLDFEMIDADKVFGYMGGNDRIALAFLDACRDNPLSRRLARTLGATRSGAVGSGLAAPQTAGTGLFIGFSTAPGDVAADGLQGSVNSPFTEAILRHIATPGLEINQVMTRVKADVRTATGDDQRPWTNSDLSTDVYLVPAIGAGAAPAGGSKVAALPTAPATQTEAPDEAHWKVIADSSIAGVFEDFIQRYPGSSRRAEAEARIAALAPQPAVPAPVPASTAVRTLAVGEWRGRYHCQQGETGLTLTITDNGKSLKGEWSFYPIPSNPSVPEGLASFEILIGDDGRLKSGKSTWVKRPAGFRAAPFSGTINAGGTVFEGTMDTAGCTTFRVERERVASLPVNEPAPTGDAPCGSLSLVASQRVDFSMCLDDRVWLAGVPEGLTEHLYQTHDGGMYFATSPEVAVAGFEQFRSFVLNNINSAPAVAKGSMKGLTESKARISARDWDVMDFDITMGGANLHMRHYRLSEVGVGSIQLLFAWSPNYDARARALSQDVVESVFVGRVGERPAIAGLAPDEDRWREIAASTDPAVLSEFVRAYPQSARRAEADARLASLNAAAAAGGTPCSGEDVTASVRINVSFCLDRGYWNVNPQQQAPSEFGFLSRDGVLGIAVNPEISVCKGDVCRQQVLDNVRTVASQQGSKATIQEDADISINGFSWHRLAYEMAVGGVTYRFINYRLSENGIGTVAFLFVSTAEFASHATDQAAAIMQTVRF